MWLGPSSTNGGFPRVPRSNSPFSIASTCSERVPPTATIAVSLAILIKTHVQVRPAVSSNTAPAAVRRVLVSLKMARKSITIEILILH